MKSPLHFILGLPGHIKHPEGLFEHFHKKIHHAFAVFALAMIGMLWGASNILTHTSASWTWGGFMTSDFWEQSPSDGNIKYALFGDGTPGSTAYTRLWSSSCVPTSITGLNASTFHGGSLAANTIYILTGGTYTLTNQIFIDGNCSAIIGKGDVYIKGLNSSITTLLVSSSRSQIIMDNIKLDGQNISDAGIEVVNANNVTINNSQAYAFTTGSLGLGIYIQNSNNISVNNSLLYNNNYGFGTLATGSGTYSTTINNSQFYNNNGGFIGGGSIYHNNLITINNSQIYNNSGSIVGNFYAGIYISNVDYFTINNCQIYDNSIGIMGSAQTTGIINNTTINNNIIGIYNLGVYFNKYTFYGTLKMFGNTINTGGGNTGRTLEPGAIPPVLRSAGTLDTTTTTMSSDWVTNPQNGNGKRLLSGTNRTGLKGPQIFDATKRPIRYIFGGSILKQITPVWNNGGTLTEYTDYISTRYIAEPDSTLPLNQQTIVNQYFGSGSIYTQNWQTNGCSLSAFQVVTLNSGTFTNANNKFQDHTIYLLTGGEYLSITASGFVFNGNCIALIGNNDTKFTKSVANTASVLYANNKRNIIIDNIKVDAKYFNNGWFSSFSDAQSAIQFDGASNNSTINNVQAYNATLYGIYLGLNSHHNTIINTQAFNNGSAGIHLYYASNYNVINNTQTYNNLTYGIWFANGSSRNTMNNFQSYNNGIGVFGDLTTQENIVNRAAIYNNSDAGIYLKNSSGNSLNDVRLYHNGVGIRTLYSSMGNKYYGDLKLFNNTANFDGTIGGDTNLSAGTAGIFPYAGVLTTGSNIITCLDVTNPILSGLGTSLLNGNGTCSFTGYNASFISPEPINYEFGLNMYKQKIPMRYTSGNTLVPIPSQYDATKYIAEIFAIRDNTPEGMTFASSGAAQLNTWYTTNVYTAAVLNVAVPVTLTLTGGSATGYLTISGTNVGLTGIANNGDILQIHVLTRTGYSETVTGSITVGTANTGFTVTTRGMNTTPTTGSFAFANLTSIPVNIFTGSSTTIAGIETGVSASIIFLPVTTSGRLEVYSGTTLLGSGTTGVNVMNGNQVKVIAQSSSGYAQTVTGNVTIGLGTGMFTLMTKGSDSTPPTTPTLTYPLSGEELFFITFNWNASTDTGSGLEGYEYQIAEDTSFIDIVHTGFISTVTGTMGSPNNDFDVTRANEYYWRIKAKDRDGNYSTRSNTGYFQTININNRDFTNKNDANLRTYYDSNKITLEGIKPGLTLWASVDGNGKIYKNGSDKGTGTLVQNGDDIYITLRSSNNYDDTVASVLTIANRTVEFAVTTKLESNNGCSLTSTDEEAIQTIFDSLVANYSGDVNKFDEFLYTMQSMLTDQIDFTNDCNLQYLQDLINATIGGGTGSINTGNHIAPNCKEYPVSFDAVKVGYTSPVFKVITYFSNRDSLARYIDSKNPGDCHINTYAVSSWIFTNTNPNKHIASNGKMYTIQSSTQGYTSAEFSTAKYFGTLAGLRNYIDSNNIPQAIRSHQVDTSFTPQTYTAPNGKEYMIYKTDRGYMSYKLIKVRYFSTLSEIQTFIKTNNK